MNEEKREDFIEIILNTILDNCVRMVTTGGKVNKARAYIDDVEKRNVLPQWDCSSLRSQISFLSQSERFGGPEDIYETLSYRDRIWILVNLLPCNEVDALLANKISYYC